MAEDRPEPRELERKWSDEKKRNVRQVACPACEWTGAPRGYPGHYRMRHGRYAPGAPHDPRAEAPAAPKPERGRHPDADDEHPFD